MSRSGLWIGVVLVAAGLCGMLDVAGIASWSQTMGEWWPLILVAWPVSEMIAARAVTLSALVWSGLGIALLSDGRQWTSGALTWSAFVAFVGIAVLTDVLATGTSRQGSASVGAGGPVNPGPGAPIREDAR